MEWLNPTGWWAWLAIPVVIALYLLRRKATQHTVPSLLLWQWMESAKEAHKPFQRLRKQWLLWLQLVLAALLALALMRPAGSGGMRGDSVLVFDVSASMQAQSAGQSRLEEAVADATTLVDAMQEGDTITLLTAGQMVEQPISRSADKQKIKAALAELKAENGTADMDGALSLALAMQRDLPELSIIAYSDAWKSAEQTVETRQVGKNENNRSVLSLRCSEQEDGMIAFARVSNFGDACEITLECYADGVLCDLKTVTLETDGSQNVQMHVPGRAQLVWVEIKTPDALLADNTAYWIEQAPSERKILLVTEGNVFLEKALSLRGGVAVYKTSPADAAQAEGYDLYLFDGPLPEVFPESGNVLALQPGGKVGSIHPQEEKQSAGRMRAAANSLAQTLTENMMLPEIALRAYTPLTGGESVLTWNGDTLLAVEEQNGRRMAALGFDLHDSNLPMQADFPILMQNLLEFLLPEAITAVDSAVCGQPVTLALDDRVQSAWITTPAGRKVPVESGAFTDTKELGVYTLLEERVDGQERITVFALQVPVAEMELRNVAAHAQTEAVERAEKVGFGKEWTPYLLAAFLLLLMVEWEVSRRGA